LPGLVFHSHQVQPLIQRILITYWIHSPLAFLRINDYD